MAIFRDQLRKKAMDNVQHTRQDIDSMKRDEIQNLIYELEVHQVELEMQNDELIKVQEELESLSDKYQDLYDFAPVGYFTMNQDGVIIEANLSMSKLLGIERQFLLKSENTFFKFIDKKDYDLLGNHLSAVLNGHSKESLELQLSSGFYLLQSINSNMENGVKCCRSVLIDISQQKKNEELLSMQTRQKDEFIAMLAHELRNPLAAIGSATMILENKTMAEKHDWARSIIKHQQSNLSHIIDDLLDVSRITRGKFELKKHTLNVQDILQRAIEVSKPFITKNHHALLINSSPVYVEADPTRLEQILVNLLLNAAKYTPPGGKIEVSCRDEKGKALMVVKDNGTGFAPELSQKLFDLFVQENGRHGKIHGGLGIGLTLVRTLCEMHGGQVKAESPGKGKGATFTVSLPAVEGRGVIKEKDSFVHPDKASESRRILLVEDSIDTACAMAILFESSGYTVELAHNGEEAITKAEEFKPDRVVLDIGLPGKLNGWDVIEKLKSSGHHKNTRFVCLSGYGQESDIERSKKAGFDFHLVKPVDYGKLVSILEKPAV
jgi:signal transduction histidine kinase/CheY-like chemotaxis protein